MARQATLAVLLAAGVACARGERHEPAPEGDTASGTATPKVTVESVAPGPAIQALTRNKGGDDDYIAAIGALETASGAADAAKDLGAGGKQLIGIPQSDWSKLPGVSVPRDRIPPNVRIVKISGIIDGTSNRHAMRFQMLAERYAKDYNSTMIRSIMQGATP